MTDEFRSELRSSKAFKVFLAELSKDLQNFEQLMASENFNQSQCQQLSESFHRVKGGAGFFGLDNICKIASEIEDLTKALDSVDTKERDSLRSYLKQLKQEERDLNLE